MSKAEKYNVKYVYIIIHGLPTRAMIETGVEDNIITRP